MALGALGAPRALGAADGRKRPNIIFFFSDEHRWCSMPFTETPDVVAPNMARLAREGTRFDNCCSTSPVCMPYRGMLITGQWPHQSSCISNDYFGNDKVIGTESPTIAHTFKKAAYVTGYVGKWQLNDGNEPEEKSVYDAGFDYHKNWLLGNHHWNTKFRDVPSHEPYNLYTQYNAVGMTDQALEFIGQQARGDKPFFLMLSLNPPHWRWDDAPEEFLRLYSDDKLPYRPNVTGDKYKSDGYRSYYRHYHAHISAVDHELGRVMDALKQYGLEEDTLLIYTSDHGSSFGSNGVINKCNPFDEAVRVPFIVRWPGRVPANTVVDHNFATIDLYPTLCGLAGATPPSSCGGQDFSPVILGKPGPDPASQLIMLNSSQKNYFETVSNPDAPGVLCPFRGVRTKRYTYAVGAKGDWILYDNQKDPYQVHNLVHNPAYANVKAELQKELKDWLAKAEDPFIPKDWRHLSLPERIAAQNKYYSLLPLQNR